MAVETTGLDNEALYALCLSVATQVGLSEGSGASHERGEYLAHLEALKRELCNRLNASLSGATQRVPAFLVRMYPWGEPSRDLVEQFAASAVYLGRYDTGTSRPEVHAYRTRLAMLAEAVRARLDGTFPPYPLKCTVRIKAGGSAKVEPLARSGMPSIRNASKSLVRSSRAVVQQLNYIGRGAWSVTFLGSECRYPAEQFELVPQEVTQNTAA